ncbi:MAG: SUMF1/EgtB/PvdO family nonheme iron enzyme [Symploca sp. SIO3E6]|nr:SUMF1/EgtB/PvdO family nonheme iron enzyme [Caldora sp. SIO3E6]
MTDWALVIGINSYKGLQTLKYAERDASLMRDFFAEEAKFEQIFYYSDNSPAFIAPNGFEQNTQPNYTNLRSFLRDFFEEPQLEPGDNFWFFFSGHGIRHQDRDYLMPCDVNPRDLEATAIPVNYITERLRRCGADNIVLLLDACREEGSKSGLGIGMEKHQGVITISSCAPSERSYEIGEDIQQGAFTYALLESLRIQGEGNCATVERLYHRLRYRVTEINDYYGKPRQTPYAIAEPASKYHLILLPRQATEQDIATLREDAQDAELEGDLQLAEQLLTRVLALSPADPKALKALKRIWGLSGKIVKPAPPPIPQKSGTKSQTITPPLTKQAKQAPPPRQQIRTRRQLIQVAGFGSVGLVGAVIAHQVWNRNSSSPEYTTSPIEIEETGTTIESPSPAIESQSLPIDKGKVNLKPFNFDVVTVDSQGKETSPNSRQAKFFAQDLGNRVMLEMVEIPGGKFMRGSLPTEKGHTNQESPQIEVTVPPFFIGKYPVTQAQWRVVAALPKVKIDLEAEPSGFKGDNLPVEQVSWYDAEEFCARLSTKSRHTYRLPSEAEWEYACRAGTTTPFHFGETITSKLANYKGIETYHSEPEGPFLDQTTPVGHFQVANAFGLYDIHGNVREWCKDTWHKSYRGVPQDGSAWNSNNDNDSRLLRGGNWFSPPVQCRSAFRTSNSPGASSDKVGFRVVCEAAQTL